MTPPSRICPLWRVPSSTPASSIRGRSTCGRRGFSHGHGYCIVGGRACEPEDRSRRCMRAAHRPVAMLLADEFYLIAHQDSTGKPRLHAKPAGLATGAALLAELYLL